MSIDPSRGRPATRTTPNDILRPLDRISLARSLLDFIASSYSYKMIEGDLPCFPVDQAVR